MLKQTNVTVLFRALITISGLPAALIFLLAVSGCGTTGTTGGGSSSAGKIYSQSGSGAETQENPLFHAVKSGTLDDVKKLVAQGSDIHERSKDQLTPLHWAVLAEKEEVVQYFLDQGADINSQSPFGSPLLMAVHENRESVAMLLIAKGAGAEVKDDKGRVALHYARSGALVIRLLKNGGNLNSRDNNGSVPLHTISFTGYIFAVQALLESGADVNAKDKTGYTPLDIAAIKGRVGIEMMLRQHGGKVGKLEESQLSTVEEKDPAPEETD